jgi:hypothetical protein
MHAEDSSTPSLRVIYETLLHRAERVRQLMPSPFVMANEGGRARLVLHLGELQAALKQAPTYGGPDHVRKLKREVTDLNKRISVVIARLEEGDQPTKLHRDTAAVLEAARALIVERLRDASEAA